MIMLREVLGSAFAQTGYHSVCVFVCVFVSVFVSVSLYKKALDTSRHKMLPNLKMKYYSRNKRTKVAGQCSL